MGLSRQKVELRSVDHETALAKDHIQASPFALTIIPVGIEALLGWQQQVRGFVIPNFATNRFLAPEGIGLGNANGWHFGFVHYRIPRETNCVRLLVSNLKGCALRFARAEPYLKIGVSKTTVTTIFEEAANGDVDYSFSRSVPDFNYTVSAIASP